MKQEEANAMSEPKAAVIKARSTRTWPNLKPLKQFSTKVKSQAAKK